MSSLSGLFYPLKVYDIDYLRHYHELNSTEVLCYLTLRAKDPFKKGYGLTIEELMNRLGKSSSTIYRALKKLRDKGLILYKKTTNFFTPSVGKSSEKIGKTTPKMGKIKSETLSKSEVQSSYIDKKNINNILEKECIFPESEEVKEITKVDEKINKSVIKKNTPPSSQEDEFSGACNITVSEDVKSELLNPHIKLKVIEFCAIAFSERYPNQTIEESREIAKKHLSKPSNYRKWEEKYKEEKAREEMVREKNERELKQRKDNLEIPVNFTALKKISCFLRGKSQEKVEKLRSQSLPLPEI